jgi:cytochrome b
VTSAEREPGTAVWDPVVRVLHWALAASIAAAWVTRHGYGVWHERIGYASLIIVTVRFVWGWIGPRYARFGQFVRTPSATLRYAGQMLGYKEARYIGHNPLGGWMILALLAVAALAGSSGWLYTTDAYWGVEWVEDLHEALAIFLLVLVALHVAGVVAASWRHRENLVAAMIHGRKRQAEKNDVT